MKNLIANELNSKGFQVTTFGNSVIVKLSNRKVSTIEVKMALIDIEAELIFQSLSDGVMVS